MIGPLTYRRLARLVAVALVVALAAGTAGCSRPASTPAPSSTPAGPSPAANATPAPDPTAATSTVPGNAVNRPERVSFEVFFVKGEKLRNVGRSVPYTPKIAAAAVEQLLKGPSAEEKKAGLRTSMPAGTKLRGVRIANGTATVDFNSGFAVEGGLLGAQLRLAQVVYTLTQFTGVSRVVFAVNGERMDVFTGDGIDISAPQRRGDYEDFVNAVVFDGLHDGSAIRSPKTVSGTANVFEARFSLDLVDDGGKVIATVPVQAKSGTGTRGSFDVTLYFRQERSGEGRLIAWYASPKDGSRVVAEEVRLKVLAP